MTNLFFISIPRLLVDGKNYRDYVEQLIRTALKADQGNLHTDPEVMQINRKGMTAVRVALLEFGLPMPLTISLDIFAAGRATLIYERGRLVQMTDRYRTWDFECAITLNRTMLSLPAQADLACQLIGGIAPGSYIPPEDID